MRNCAEMDLGNERADAANQLAPRPIISYCNNHGFTSARIPQTGQIPLCPDNFVVRRRTSRRFEGIEEADDVVTTVFFNCVQNNPSMTGAAYDNSRNGT
jgi:hypothetical protein